MASTSEIIKNYLHPLIGLQLTIVRRVADMRIFHFGPVQSVEGGSVGEYALHIQCPWRIESPEGIVTGRSDLWESSTNDPDFDADPWNYENGNRQDYLLGTLLGSYRDGTGSFINKTNKLIVETVEGDEYGGGVILFSEGYRLVIFPAGSAESEDWRIFRPSTDEPHFVVSGGKIETEK